MALPNFSQAFVTPKQRAITIAKILVDKWFYVYGIPACVHSNKARALTMKSCHIYMPCTELSNQPPCHTIHMEMLQPKD